jgi:hypothetical protein
MSKFHIKTHKPGRTYSAPHFFILNKGLNSGKPLEKPCTNCFVVQTGNEATKNNLFNLSLMLQIGGFYKFHLKGSVIPFITLKDCDKTILVYQNSLESLNKELNLIALMNQKENELKLILKKIHFLKISYVRSALKLNHNSTF